MLRSPFASKFKRSIFEFKIQLKRILTFSYLFNESKSIHDITPVSKLLQQRISKSDAETPLPGVQKSLQLSPSSSPMFLTLSVKLDSKSRYKKDLDDYFSTTEFQFVKENHEASLKHWMSQVYLREIPLVAIDVEAWERNLKKVTEIGVAIYDPTSQDNSIIPQIKVVHLIVKENKQMYNGKFVRDNKHNFMGGTSYVISLKEAAVFLDQLFEAYIVKRNGTIVGHHIEGDIKWLRQMKVTLKESTPTVDTGKIFQLSKSSGGTLKGLLKLVDIPHAFLHNAANDAYYTLLAAFAYCDPKVRATHDLDTFEQVPSQSKGKRQKDKNSGDKAESVEYNKGNELFEEFFSK